MSYQLCRWYDPYPRLAFALKLLYFAPDEVQVRVARQLRNFLNEQWGAADIARILKSSDGKTQRNRWYDEDRETSETVELVKNSPEFLKSRVADTLLKILVADLE